MKKIDEGLRHGRRVFDLSFLEDKTAEDIKKEYESRNWQVVISENSITFKEKTKRKLLHG